MPPRWSRHSNATSARATSSRPDARGSGSPHSRIRHRNEPVPGRGLGREEPAERSLVERVDTPYPTYLVEAAVGADDRLDVVLTAGREMDAIVRAERPSVERERQVDGFVSDRQQGREHGVRASGETGEWTRSPRQLDMHKIMSLKSLITNKLY